MADVAESEDRCLLLALDHRVHVSLLDDIGTYDFGTCAPEDYGEQCADLDDGVADDSGLKLGVEIEFFLRGCFGVLGHEHQFGHHTLDWFDQQRVDVSGKQMQQQDENEADEQGLGEREVGVYSIGLALVENGSQ